MSDPTSPGHEAPNPFEAPRAEVVRPSVATTFESPEAFRRAYIGQETSVKLLRLPAHVAALFGVAALMVALLEPSRNNPAAGPDLVSVVKGTWPLILLATLGALVLGYGLRRLRPWARWLASALAVAVLAGTFFSAAIPATARDYPTLVLAIDAFAMAGYALYILSSQKAAVVFSWEYRKIVPRTPRVRPQFSEVIEPVTWNALVFLVAAVGIVLTIRKTLGR